jgi:sugar phosphate isomerase/epimerase
MNVRASIHELDRIRRDIGAALRIEYAAEPGPETLLTLLKDLEARIRDVERGRLVAEVDARIAELVHGADG